MSSRLALALVVLLGGAGIHCQRPAPAPQPRPGEGPGNPASSLAIKPPAPQLLPPSMEGALPCDSKDQQAVIVGPTTRAAILAHRPIFEVNTGQAELPPELFKRWKELSTPCILVVAFGSWCGDSQRELPDFLALMAEENPFVKVAFLGVYRDKKVPPGGWPEGLEPQAVVKVPTFWLYVLQPGGTYHLAGSIVENPPKKGQHMAEAIVELLEQAK